LKSFANPPALIAECIPVIFEILFGEKVINWTAAKKKFDNVLNKMTSFDKDV